MHDFSCTDAKDMKHRTLAERVRYFKEEEQMGLTTWEAALMVRL